MTRGATSPVEQQDIEHTNALLKAILTELKKITACIHNYMYVIEGSERWFCRVIGCDDFTYENVRWGYCPKHALFVAEGGKLPEKMGWPAPVAQHLPDPEALRLVHEMQQEARDGTARLRELAYEPALELHGYAIDTGELDGHRHPFVTCPHPDCALVRPEK